MGDAVMPTLIISLLLLLNALFVAAEFSVVGVSRPAIEQRVATSGDWRARMVVYILRDARQRDRFIATAQLGITLASLGLGMYGEHLIAAWLAEQFEALGADRWVAAHTLASVIAVTFLTYLHIVIGEMVPKSLALQRPEHTILWIAPVMRVIQLAVLPLIIALNAIGDAVLRLAGVRRDRGRDEQYRTTEELGYLVKEAQEGGLLRSAQARIVAELLDFGDLTAGEVMVPRVRVAGIPLGSDAAALRKMLRAHPFTRYPVYDGTIDHVVGMLHVKDILRCLPSCDRLRLADVRAVPFLPATASMDQVMASLRAARAQLAIVMDEHGGTAGILTVEDLFEEIVGDVGDESGARPQVVSDGEGQIRVTGGTRLELLGDSLGVDVEHEEVDTVSGLVLALLGRPPVRGDVVRYRGVRLEVSEVRGHGVAEVRATVIEPGSAPNA